MKAMYRAHQVFTIVFGAALLATGGVAQTQPASQAGLVGIPEDTRFACPMETHPDETDPARQGAYFSPEAGKCPWCGMQLKPVDELAWVAARLAAQGAEVAYTCPAHQNVFSRSGGDCPRCKRELEPFKVMYTCPDTRHAGVIRTQPGTCPHCGRKLAPYRGVWLAPEMAESNVPPNPGAAEGAAYRCPVHPLAHSARPGQCPICAADLQATAPAATQPALPAVPPAAQYLCPMHPDQVGAEARGTCPICGMQLVSAAALPKPADAPAAIATQMNYLMEHYLALHKRFASDTTKDVALHSLGLVGAADEILAHADDPAVKIPPDFFQAARTLRSAALKTTGRNLDADRVTFVQLSGAMRKLIEQLRPSREQYPMLYLFHCPMTKGDWIQATEELANPFYGFKMLKCGERTGTK